MCVQRYTVLGETIRQRSERIKPSRLRLVVVTVSNFSRYCRQEMRINRRRSGDRRTTPPGGDSLPTNEERQSASDVEEGFSFVVERKGPVAQLFTPRHSSDEEEDESPGETSGRSEDGTPPQSRSKAKSVSVDEPEEGPSSVSPAEISGGSADETPPRSGTTTQSVGEEELEEGRTCVICLSRRRNVCFSPCGHIPLCMECAPNYLNNLQRREALRRNNCVALGLNDRDVLCPLCRSPTQFISRALVDS